MVRKIEFLRNSLQDIKEFRNKLDKLKQVLKELSDSDKIDIAFNDVDVGLSVIVREIECLLKLSYKFSEEV